MFGLGCFLVLRFHGAWCDFSLFFPAPFDGLVVEAPWFIVGSDLFGSSRVTLKEFRDRNLSKNFRPSNQN